MNKSLTLVFTCSDCNMHEVQVYVRARQPAESVTDWMEQAVIPKVSEAHNLLSPGCKSRKMDHLKIPISPKGVGFALED